MVQKDSRELLGQLVNTHNGQIAESVVNSVGYGKEKVRPKLLEMAGLDPEGYDFFLYSLRKEIRENEMDVRQSFDTFLSEHQPKHDTTERITELSKRVVVLDNEIPEEIGSIIREMFPSGNYLIHGTSVEGALDIASDDEGRLKSIAEINKTNKKKGKGGFAGISFSYNGVGALPGTWRHLTMFITSPEMALGDGDKKLVVPYYAANNELQLVPSEYNKDAATFVDSTLDFLGLSNLFGNKGVIHDIAELESPYNCDPGDSPIEKNIKQLKAGLITSEQIESNYQIIDGKFVVNPMVTEGDISEGTVWLDYLLKHTEQGMSLDKSADQLSLEEIKKLFESTKGEIKKLIRQVEKISELVTAESESSMPIEDTVMFVSQSDLKKWLNVFARTEHFPKVIVAYPTIGGPKVPNWRVPEGDWDKANLVVSKWLGQCNVPIFDMPFDLLLEKSVEEKDLGGKYIKHLKWDVVKGSKDIVLADGQISLHKS